MTRRNAERAVASDELFEAVQEAAVEHLARDDWRVGMDRDGAWEWYRGEDRGYATFEWESPGELAFSYQVYVNDQSTELLTTVVKIVRSGNLGADAKMITLIATSILGSWFDNAVKATLAEEVNTIFNHVGFTPTRGRTSSNDATIITDEELVKFVKDIRDLGL